MRAWLGFVVASMTLVGASAAGPLHFDDPKIWRIDYRLAPAKANWLLFGDVNGDHKADLVLYDSNAGKAWVALSNGINFGAPVLVASNLPIAKDIDFYVELADVNGDGKADLVFFNHGADNVAGAATASVALSTGSGFAAPAVWNSSWCATYQFCHTADINGDGKADLVAFTPSYGTVWGSTSSGTAFGPDAVWNNYFCIKGEVCALGDVDGDGKADAILFKPHAPPGQKGNVLWAHSTGSAFTNVQTGHGYFCVDYEHCLVGDVNGDGKADIVLVKGYQTNAPAFEVLVALSNGKQFIDATPFTWGTVPHLSPEQPEAPGNFALADVTGDGKADLIAWGIQQDHGTPIWTIVETFAVTDKALPAPSSPSSPSKPSQPSATGFSSVRIYNCQADQDRLYFWNADQTAHTISKSGLTDAMYSIDGTCPDPNDSPQSFSLTTGHTYLVAAVDPSAIGCDGQNDPNVVACNIGTLALKGLSTGPVCNWIVGAQTPACDITAKSQSFTGHLTNLGQTVSCPAGLVWRQAVPSDHLCVAPQIRAEVQRDNAAALSRKAPGSDKCLPGFVWRQAVAGDHVCVPAASRDRIRAVNPLVNAPRH